VSFRGRTGGLGISPIFKKVPQAWGIERVGSLTTVRPNRGAGFLLPEDMRRNPVFLINFQSEQGSPEGSPSGGVLGVSPIFFKIPQEWGISGG